MPEVYNLSFCQLELHNDYVIATMNEGIVVNKENNAVLIEIAKKHFKGKPFVYITHRINSYSVDPTVYIPTAKIKSLKGFAVVSQSPIQRAHTNYERKFFGKNFQQFNTIEEALEWKDKIIKNATYSKHNQKLKNKR